MKTFDCLNDLEDWLESLTYGEFWCAVIPHAVILPEPEKCDCVISSGALTEEQMLWNLKQMALWQIADRYNLQWQDRSAFISAA